VPIFADGAGFEALCERMGVENGGVSEPPFATTTNTFPRPQAVPCSESALPSRRRCPSCVLKWDQNKCNVVGKRPGLIPHQPY
jgi:hypothetical protein